MSIAGSDPSGGAGIQADLRTFERMGVHGAAVVSLITYQNSLGVHGMEVLPASWVASQARAVLEDLPVGAVKIGALGGAEVVRAVAGVLAGRGLPLVLDTVMASKAGRALLSEAAIDACWERLFPMATVLTPNLDEISILLRRAVTNVEEMHEAARELCAKSGAGAVLVKGGHLEGDRAVDVLYGAGQWHRWSHPRVSTVHTRGTGCTYASAIASGLAKGLGLVDAVAQARGWLQSVLETAFPLGAGRGRLG